MTSANRATSVAVENAFGASAGVVDRDVWFVSADDSDPDLSGFADPLSVDGRSRSNVVRLKIRSSYPFSVDVFRLGWYGGRGARRMAKLADGRPFPRASGRQPPPRWEDVGSTVDCGNWRTSATYVHPARVPSGVFVALVRTSEGPNRGQGRLIPFVVRDDSRCSAILFQLPDITWQAYNLWTDDLAHSAIEAGVRANGAFYSPDAAGGVTTRASYRRPLSGSAARLPDGRPYDTTCGFTLFWETVYPAVRWLERIGADVSYTTGQAVAADPSLLLPRESFRRLFMTAGHDEYWSQEQRDGVEQARRAGVHCAFLSGNDMFWRVRWDGADTVVCAKESNLPPRPGADRRGHTGLWADDRGGDGRAENATTGSRSAGQGASRELLVSPVQGRHRFWRDTCFERRGTRDLDAGRARHRAIGHEWNHDEDNGWRPPGLVHLSATPMAGTSLVRGDGDPARGRSASVHHLTMFRDAGSGSVVFHAGSIDFARVLDGFRVNGTARGTDDTVMRSVQQALVNLLADTGLPPPATLPEHISWSPPTFLPEPPTVSIDPPVGEGEGETVVRGTASAGKGAHVAAIEVSVVDRWWPAVGAERWHARIPARGAGGVHRLRVRAVDDRGQIGDESVVALPTSAAPLAIRPGNRRTLWVHTVEPQLDRVPVETEAGCGWTPRTDELVEGVAFWRAPDDRGARYVNLWQILDGEGTRLASAPADEDTAGLNGWSEAHFRVGIEVTAGCRYVASVRSESGFAYALEPPPASTDLGEVEARCSRWARDKHGACRFPDGRLARDRPPAPAPDGLYPLVEPLFVSTPPRRHTLWPESGVEPACARLDLGRPAEVGLVFSSDVPGAITAVRFFNVTAGGAWVVNLWDCEGRRLGTNTAGSVRTDADGWQEVPLGRPVPVSAGVPCTASYTTPSGIVACTDDLYACGLDDPVRTLVLRAYGGVLGPPGRPPVASPARLNPCYFVDVVFSTGG